LESNGKKVDQGMIIRGHFRPLRHITQDRDFAWLAMSGRQYSNHVVLLSTFYT
jgi:hypothetical protein